MTETERELLQNVSDWRGRERVETILLLAEGHSSEKERTDELQFKKKRDPGRFAQAQRDIDDLIAQAQAATIELAGRIGRDHR